MVGPTLTIDLTINEMISNVLFSCIKSYLGGFGVDNHKPYVKYKILHGGGNHATTVSGSHVEAA